MIDIQIVRGDPELVKKIVQQKGYKVDIDKLLQLDNDRKELLLRVEALRQKRNEVATKMKNGRPDQALIDEGKELKVQLAEQEKYLKETETERFYLLKDIPNLPLEDVPVGTSEADNVVDKTWGEKPRLDFEVKNHWQIAEAHDWIDKERAAKVTGSRFV